MTVYACVSILLNIREDGKVATTAVTGSTFEGLNDDVTDAWGRIKLDGLTEGHRIDLSLAVPQQPEVKVHEVQPKLRGKG